MKKSQLKQIIKEEISKTLNEDQKSLLLNQESIRDFGIFRGIVDKVIKGKVDDEELREYQIVKDELEDALDRYYDFIVEMDKIYPD